MGYKLPAKEKPDIALYISALHASRKAFVAIESSHKMKLLLLKKIRRSEITYNIGDDVFYKGDNNRAWKGPITVMNQDSPVVFIQKGSYHINAHTFCVQLLNPDHFIETETMHPDQYTKRKGENSTNNNNSNLNRVRSATEEKISLKTKSYHLHKMKNSGNILKLYHLHKMKDIRNIPKIQKI